jgi:hypothetical protein
VISEPGFQSETHLSIILDGTGRRYIVDSEQSGILTEAGDLIRLETKQTKKKQTLRVETSKPLCKLSDIIT